MAATLSTNSLHPPAAPVAAPEATSSSPVLRALIVLIVAVAAAALGFLLAGLIGAPIGFMVGAVVGLYMTSPAMPWALFPIGQVATPAEPQPQPANIARAQGAPSE